MLNATCMTMRTPISSMDTSSCRQVPTAPRASLPTPSCRLHLRACHARQSISSRLCHTQPGGTFLSGIGRVDLIIACNVVTHIIAVICSAVLLRSRALLLSIQRLYMCRKHATAAQIRAKTALAQGRSSPRSTKCLVPMLQLRGWHVISCRCSCFSFQPPTAAQIDMKTRAADAGAAELKGNRGPPSALVRVASAFLYIVPWIDVLTLGREVYHFFPDIAASVPPSRCTSIPLL